MTIIHHASSPGAKTTVNRPRHAKSVDSFFRSAQRLFKVFAYPGFCNLCRRPTLFVITDANLRENVICLFCRSNNRMRQIYHVISSLSGSGSIRIWNMEHSGVLHNALLKVYGDAYVSSAYLGKGIAPGTFKGNTRHEDVRKTSFPSNHFDLVISCDVLEHVPSPEKAFKEVYRILKPGGKFVFTAPFMEDQEKSDIRAIEDDHGEVVCLKEPQYHGDPLRPEGILVFTLFGWDMLDMIEAAGMQCSFHVPYFIRYGMIGGPLVFSTIKPAMRT